MRTTALVRIAKMVGDQEWEHPESVGAGLERFWGRGALKLKHDAPVRIDHDRASSVGRVLELFEFDEYELDGRWTFAHVELDEPPAWLERGTPASMSWANLGNRELMPGGWTRITKGFVTEVSLLSPGRVPHEPAAQVTYISEPVARRARRT